MARDNASLSNVFNTLQGNAKINHIKDEVKKDNEEGNKDNLKDNEHNLETKKTPKSNNTVKNETPTDEVPAEEIPVKTDAEESTSSGISKEVVEEYSQEVPVQKESQNPFGESLINKINEKRNKPTIEETHTRNTLFIRNDLHKRMERITKKRRGLKTLLVNEAIEAVLDAIEDNKK